MIPLAVTPWEWVTATSFDTLLTALGGLTLAALFATNRILTRGQHLDRVADLKEHHARELDEKEARIAEVKESRDGWKAVALTERERANAAASSVEDVGDSLVRIEHVLESIDSALPEPPEGRAG